MIAAMRAIHVAQMAAVGHVDLVLMRVASASTSGAVLALTLLMTPLLDPLLMALSTDL